MAEPVDRESVLREIERLQQQLIVLRRRVCGPTLFEPIPKGELSLLLFKVGEERGALLLGSIEKVVMICTVTQIPEAPPWILGLLTFRGDLIPVVDLNTRISGERRDVQLSDLIVICRHDERRVGLVVQEVLDVVHGAYDVHQTTGDEVPYAPYLLGVLGLEGGPTFLFSVASLVATTAVLETLG